MLCPSHHQPATFLHGSLRPNPNNPNLGSFFPSLSLPFPPLLSRKPLLSSSFLAFDSGNQSIDPSPEEFESQIDPSRLSRRQNARSSSLLLRHFQPQHEKTQYDPVVDDEEQEEELQRKRIVDEVSLATRRVPRFPGSIDFPQAEQLDPPADLRRVVGSDDRVLKRALEVRRGVAAEILKEALQAGRLSIRYSANLVSKLPDFVDRVVIEAAAMKGVSEFSHLSFNARAKSYIQSSGAVPLVKWLKHNSMTHPQIGKGEYLGVVLVKAGPIFHRRLDTLDEIVNYLETNGVRRDWLGFVVTRCPQVLALSMEELECRVKFYLDMGMNENDFGTMVFDYPRVLGFYSMEDMNSKVQYLKEFGLSTEDVGRLLAFKPQLMGCSIEERWKPLVKYLYYLGVRRDGMRRMLMIKPMIFCVDLETTIAPKVRFLQDIGIKSEAIGGVLVKFPPILTYSLYKKIRPVVIFLMTKAGVTQKDIGKVIALDPQLVGCHIIQKLEINVKYFLSLGVRLQLLGEMIADFPMLLRYNLDVLRPKYRFFSYSLDGRIVPRHKILVENRINFKLRYMLAVSDEEFNQRVQVAIEKRKRFESAGTYVELPDSESTDMTPVAS
ncbi:Transcription termination factor MTERF2, chloroplastic [Cocos nucifera]|uniref:Transcription termination factor MTERF2, chloroplastic n=1 Tax=Cocos nucifera TaxID=13894 RepID=A0A8K0NDC5_COCNU|nr:Transcription termination factor MTERF2, chloroplastic [Cocos nucifera]